MMYSPRARCATLMTKTRQELLKCKALAKTRSYVLKMDPDIEAEDTVRGM